MSGDRTSAAAAAPRAALTVALSDRVHAVPGGVNCALVDLGDGGALLVDSGLDKEYGRKIRKALDGLGLTLQVILVTHSHADHFGGNAYLLRQYPEAQVWAPEVEAELIRTPYLEPVYLFHGAKPLPELQGKWLMADPSPVHRVVGPGELTLGEVTITLVDVRGHAHRQLAVLIGDVLLAADAVFGSETLAKYPILFAQDVIGQLAAHDTIARQPARVLLPGHGAATEDLAGVAALNRSAVLRAADAVLGACDGATTEGVLAAACRTLGIVIDDLARYHLNLCVVAAHLSRLRELGMVTCDLVAARLEWRQA